MILGVIADDFTGASDIAAMLSRGGMQTELFIGVPAGADTTTEAGVVALKSRSIPADDAVAQSLAALAWLEGQGCRQIVFKYCSTFDSTPAGNIGPVAEALAERLNVRGVVACPALPENSRTVYLGHLFVKERLLNESGLERHPLNPMTDSDIRRWLARQSRGEVGLVGETIVSQGAEALRAALAEHSETLVIVDAINDRDLVTIGQAVADAPLVTGGSGVAMALPENFRKRGLLAGQPAPYRAAKGPAVILSGSCSPMTRLQVETYGKQHAHRIVDVDVLMRGGDLAGELTAFAQSNRDQAPLIYSSAEPEIVALAQAKHGREKLAEALENLFGEIAGRLIGLGFDRLVVAGGETSGAVVSAISAQRFTIGPEIAAGVPALSTEDVGPLAMALKSGNFGEPDFFERAVRLLAGGQP